MTTSATVNVTTTTIPMPAGSGAPGAYRLAILNAAAVEVMALAVVDITPPPVFNIASLAAGNYTLVAQRNDVNNNPIGTPVQQPFTINTQVTVPLSVVVTLA